MWFIIISRYAACFPRSLLLPFPTPSALARGGSLVPVTYPFCSYWFLNLENIPPSSPNAQIPTGLSRLRTAQTMKVLLDWQLLKTLQSIDFLCQTIFSVILMYSPHHFVEAGGAVLEHAHLPLRTGVEHDGNMFALVSRTLSDF